MTYQTNLRNLNTLCLQRGWENPNCSAELYAEGGSGVWVRARKTEASLFKWSPGDCSAEHFTEASKIVPDREKFEYQEFRQATAKLLEQGRALGFDGSELEPIKLLMEKLSENILENFSQG